MTYRARVKVAQFSDDLFPEQCFAVFPQIGSSIAIQDKNANMHRLVVVGMRQWGWKDDSEVGEFLEHSARNVGIILICESDREWKDEFREAELRE